VQTLYPPGENCTRWGGHWGHNRCRGTPVPTFGKSPHSRAQFPGQNKKCDDYLQQHSFGAKDRGRPTQKRGGGGEEKSRFDVEIVFRGEDCCPPGNGPPAGGDKFIFHSFKGKGQKGAVSPGSALQTGAPLPGNSTAPDGWVENFGGPATKMGRSSWKRNREFDPGGYDFV